MDLGIAVMVLSVLAGGYMAWNIGANDVANSMASAVGAKAITLRQAVIIAGLLTFIGATFVGSHVTQTIRQGIIDPSVITDPKLILLGLLSALLAAALWVFFATVKSLPVSTTHSIVGAMVGFGLIVGGPSVVNWFKLLGIVVGWIISPILSGIAAFFLFRVIDKVVLSRMDTLGGAVSTTPILIAIAVFVMTLSLFLKTPLSVKLGITGIFVMLVPLLCAFAIYGAAWLFLRSVLPKLNISGGEEIFRYLQVMTSCYVALGNGANDVANAMGPLSGIYFILATGSASTHVPVPMWLLAFGGIMITVGIFTMGYRVIYTLGSRITQLTNSRGFTVDFSTASIILSASMLGLPVSTTHAAVGAFVGVGLAGGLQALDLRILWKIVVYWMITVPVAAATSAVIYLILSTIFSGW
ncbi:MAG: anion permease [Desulfomonilaceae bacterium]|nr:anion permease [Desulfomonilaceae bacterium]